ncbi:hypothetical protein HPC49_00820 [Pyxidicoccus fallax]|uniref:Uncharacterized protein n=1 Tax=Pyxidicoccus fallax TaxID=394095 RepID=A0A848L876_9BACT|nr:hypothetical protein [Pyxidicoccus fallax]NMO14814.1 hypothetical protein [Pyxidicoccus fallax]NPC76795.1 hypothetical protein [Pyxidicoccus fallax]
MKRVILVALSSFTFAFAVGFTTRPAPSDWCPMCQPCMVICDGICPNGGLAQCVGQDCLCP